MIIKIILPKRTIALKSIKRKNTTHIWPEITYAKEKDNRNNWLQPIMCIPEKYIYKRQLLDKEIEQVFSHLIEKHFYL